MDIQTHLKHKTTTGQQIGALSLSLFVNYTQTKVRLSAPLLKYIFDFDPSSKLITGGGCATFMPGNYDKLWFTK